MHYISAIATATGQRIYFSIVAQAGADPLPTSLDDIQFSGKRLLIVDDNAINRQMLTLQAQSWEMQVRTTESSWEALEWMRQGEQFDVAVLDMEMPAVNGLSLAAQIRSSSRLQELPLVMLSSCGRQRAEQSGETAEFAAIISKPIKQSQLYDAFASIFSRQPTSPRSSDAERSQFDSQLAQRMPLRILLVEDVAVNQKVALQILERLGYRADIANNGLEALEALHRQPYDVVLMDVQMPQMDGLEATRRLRQEWSSERPWIIAMTAHALQGDKEECLAAGMNDYISKPIRVKALVQALKNYEVSHGSSAIAQESLATDNEQSTKHKAQSTNPIDAQTLQDLRDMAGEDAAAIISELIESYLEDAPQRVQAISDAVAQLDAAAVQKYAHALRGLSLTIGAIPLAKLCEALEAMGRAGTTVGAATLISQLAAEYERVEAALRLLISG